MTAKGEVALGFDATCQVGRALISSLSKYSRRRHPRFQFVHLSGHFWTNDRAISSFMISLVPP